jgi:DNA-binding response OmpR family regulator
MSRTPTLLVVDDDEMSRDQLSRRLERRGFAVLQAVSGPDALVTLEKEAVDLLLLDWMMPGLSGLDVLRTLRQQRSPLELPVIMITALTGSDEVVEALEAGANDYVTKPVDFPVTLARIQAQLRAREAAAGAGPGPGPGAGSGSGSGAGSGAGEIGPGTVLDDRYRLEERIGAGGYGAVFRALHLELRQAVAVKVMQPRAPTPQAAVLRFRREGITACRVKHPNAVSVMDFSVTPEGVAFLVMELLEGHGLDEELVARGKLPLARCVEITVPVCRALAAAHAAGIVHRDIKPSNVFLSLDAAGEVVKLLDFGIAKLSGDAELDRPLTVEGIVLGTPSFIAPERVRGAAYDGRSDVYGVGAMLYRMLSGHLPFAETGGDAHALLSAKLVSDPRPLRELDPALPPAVEAVVMRALRRDPTQRPAAAALADQLELLRP